MSYFLIFSALFIYSRASNAPTTTPQCSASSHPDIDRPCLLSSTWGACSTYGYPPDIVECTDYGKECGTCDCTDSGCVVGDTTSCTVPYVCSTSSPNNYYCGTCQLPPTPQPTPRPVVTPAPVTPAPVTPAPVTPDCSNVFRPCDLQGTYQCAEWGTTSSVTCEPYGNNGCGQCTCDYCDASASPSGCSIYNQQCISSKPNKPFCGTCQGVTPAPDTPAPVTPAPVTPDCSAASNPFMDRPCLLSSSWGACKDYGYPPTIVECVANANSNKPECGTCTCNECVMGDTVGCHSPMECYSSSDYYCGTCQLPTPQPTTPAPITPAPVNPTDPCTSVDARSCDLSNPSCATGLECQQQSVYVGSTVATCHVCSCPECDVNSWPNNQGSVCADSTQLCDSSYATEFTFSDNTFIKCGKCVDAPTATPAPITPAPVTSTDPCASLARICDLSNPSCITGLECQEQSVYVSNTLVKCPVCSCPECDVNASPNNQGGICADSTQSCDGLYATAFTFSDNTFLKCGKCVDPPTATPAPVTPAPITPAPVYQTDPCAALAARSCELSNPSCITGLECKTESVSIGSTAASCPVCSCPGCNLNAWNNNQGGVCADSTQTCDGSDVTTFTFSDNTYIKCGKCVDATTPTTPSPVTPSPTTLSPTKTETDPCSTLERSCDVDDPTTCEDGLECTSESVYILSVGPTDCTVCSCPECNVNAWGNNGNGCEDSTQTCDDSDATEFSFTTDNTFLKCGTCQSTYPSVGPVQLPTTCDENECTKDIALSTCTDGTCEEVDGCRVCVEDDEDQTCTDTSSDGFCWDDLDTLNEKCKKTVSAAARQNSYSSTNTAGTLTGTVNALCEICARKTEVGDSLCECMSFGKSALSYGLKSKISAWVQQEVLSYCFAECDDMDDVIITGEECACESLECGGEVGEVQTTTTTTTEGVDVNDPNSGAYEHSIGGVVWIGFVLYLMQ
eukprot:981118_1